MDSAPGDAYNSEFILPNHPLYMHLPTGTSTHTPWSATPGDLVPGHLAPEALGAFETGDNSDLCGPCQAFDQDWTIEGSWNVHPDQLVGNGLPFVTSESDLSPIGEGAMPFSDFPDSFPLPNHVVDPWMQTEALYPRHVHMPSTEFTATENTPWHITNPLQFGFDGQNIPQSHYGERSDSTYVCEWRVDGSPCNGFLAHGDNLKHAISKHLSKAHNLLPASGKSTQKCRWAGCAKELKQESIVRHILTVHLRVTTACEACGTSFARQDSLQRHIRNSCGTCKGKQ